MRRALGILGLVLLPSASGAEVVASMTLKGPDSASPAALEEAGRALLARCELCGFQGIQFAVREGALELAAPDGFTDEMQFSIAALGYFPAKSVELRVRKQPHDGTSRTLDEVRSLESLPGAIWLPYQPIWPSSRRTFQEFLRGGWRACPVVREPSISLSVPVPFVLGGRRGLFHAWYELTEERRRALGDLPLEGDQVFALSIDGYVVACGYYRQSDRTSHLSDMDRQGNPISIQNPALYFRSCEGYNKEVEAIVRVALPFALTVAEPAVR